MTRTISDKILLRAAAALAAFGGAAAAAQETASQTVCQRGGVTRAIEIASPGTVGAKCDVVYRKPNEGVTERVVYHADNDYGFCEEKAAGIAATLVEAGWTCAPVASDPGALDRPADMVAPAPVREPVEPSPASQSSPASQPSQGPASTPAVPSAASADEPALMLPDVAAAPVERPVEPTAERTPAPQPAEAKPAPSLAPAPAETPRANEKPEPQLAAPAPSTPAAAAPVRDAPGLRPAAEPARAALRAAVPGRPSAEAVAAVLAAQQAAWNAGDIAGFMEGYWKDADLRFASGGDVTRGWRAAMKRYQARYPDTSAMGRLEFEDVDVQVLADSHALVFGRWSLALDDGSEPSGLFTLVMKKSDGVWRIVHDHTSSAG